MNAIIRSATAEDLTSLAALNRVVQDLHTEAEPSYFRSQIEPDEVEDFFSKVLSNKQMRLLIAEIAREAVGYIWFELQERPATPFTNARKRVYIHHVVVSPSYRKIGVGISLLRRVETEARACGITHVALDTWEFNEAAKEFFKHSGFDAFNIVMRKRIDISTASELPGKRSE
ncbi:GNAT family N-acetyltransferase [Methylobacterium radiotolerans]|uniref:GNAT family N-acetyltransferase n=1 Tax=Methylobacterium radiotolerans TaxID=31998 RepID=UPI0009760994|nr:GNAT family N-acetyltransferase [Methylobacterium radiotolerans]